MDLRRYIKVSLLLVLLSFGQVHAKSRALKYGMRAFKQKNYVVAADYFYLVQTQGKRKEREQATFFLAQSLQFLGMHYGAAYFFSRIAARGSKGAFFRNALIALGAINEIRPLGRSAIFGIFRKNINPLAVPSKARGFYFFYQGLMYYYKDKIKMALSAFERVPSTSPYYAKAQYYLGVARSLRGDPDGALIAYRNVSKKATKDEIQELATLNIARVLFEQKKYRQALRNYSRIPRDSDLWLSSLFESAWGFFWLQKHNNTLGNLHTIHSPFFENRFYPESYILSAVTYLRLCRYKDVVDQLKSFQQRYKPTFTDLNRMLKKYNRRFASFFRFIARYNKGRRLNEFSAATEVVDKVSRSQAFKEALIINKGLKRETRRLGQITASTQGRKWVQSGLRQALRKSYRKRRARALKSAGKDLFTAAVQLFKYLNNLSNQTKLINLEIRSGRTDRLRAQYQKREVPDDDTVWGQGLRPLDLKQQIEYWPFENEWWEDELGGYVYNIKSVCGVTSNKKKSKK